MGHLPISFPYFFPQNMASTTSFAYYLTVTILLLCAGLHVAEPVPSERSYVLSEEFINYINSLNTTWKVRLHPGNVESLLLLG